MPRALQPLPPPRRPAGLPGGCQTPLPTRVGHNSGAALAPRPCFSSGATLHLPWQSAALATVCFACGWKYAGSSVQLSQGEYFAARPLQPLLCSHASRLPRLASLFPSALQPEQGARRRGASPGTTPLPPPAQEAGTGTAAASVPGDSSCKGSRCASNKVDAFN